MTDGDEETLREARFFTDEEREAKLVEVSIAGDFKRCHKCKRAYVAFTLSVPPGAGPHSVCPSCLRDYFVRENNRLAELDAGGSWAMYRGLVLAAINELERIEWEQRWIPN